MMCREGRRMFTALRDWVFLPAAEHLTAASSLCGKCAASFGGEGSTSLSLRLKKNNRRPVRLCSDIS